MVFKPGLTLKTIQRTRRRVLGKKINEPLFVVCGPDAKTVHNYSRNFFDGKRFNFVKTVFVL